MYLEILSIVLTIIILTFLIFTSKKSKNKKKLILIIAMKKRQREIRLKLIQQHLYNQKELDRLTKILKSMELTVLKSTNEREENSKLKENLQRIRPRSMAHLKRKIYDNNVNLSSTMGNDTFSEELIDIKLKQLKVILLCSSFIQLFLLIINMTANISIDYKAFIIFLSLSWLILIYYLVLIDRFNNGYYGTNYSEARELIYYIKNQKNRNDDNTKGKKIFYHNTETEHFEKRPEVIVETECL